MRVKLRQDMLGPNPRYDWTKPQFEQAETYQVVKPAGSIIDGENAWIFMKNGEADPADEEAHAWWDKREADREARELATAEVRRVQMALAADDESEGEDDE